MVMVLYCSYCGKAVLVLRRIRSFNDAWDTLLNNVGERCPYCGHRFMGLDVRHIEYDIGGRVTRGMRVKVRAIGRQASGASY